ncbi:MAG: acyl-CoA dehydrogenase [Rhizobiales bacterium]|nr:acyl-CoA dehydrogenase [Hyphomicrobiales bacterium]
MAELFRLCGYRDAELRDVVGAGHARLLTLVSTRRFDPVLSDVAAARAYCAIAITEPEVGSDLRALATTARPQGGGYVLDGVKQYISRLEECTHLILFARTARPAAEPSNTVFLVPRDTTGLKIERMRPAGLDSVSWGRVHFSGTWIPANARVGGEGQGFSLFRRHFSYWRTMMAAVAIGSAQAAIDQAAARMRDRHAFGGPIGRFSHLQQALARWIAQLRMAWLLLEDVAAMLDARIWPIVDAAMLKAETMEIAIGAVEWAMTVFGAAGYDDETGLAKRHRDLLGLRIADGTTDVLRSQVARARLGEHLYEMALQRPGDGTPASERQTRKFW